MRHRREIGGLLPLEFPQINPWSFLTPFLLEADQRQCQRHEKKAKCNHPNRLADVKEDLNLGIGEHPDHSFHGFATASSKAWRIGVYVNPNSRSDLLPSVTNPCDMIPTWSTDKSNQGDFLVKLDKAVSIRAERCAIGVGICKKGA
jgi:hypothetical protein